MPDRSFADRVFLTRRGTPRLVPCAVLFLDLLGVREMNRGPLRDVKRNLAALEQAVSTRYRDYLSAESPWPASFFSDTLVLAAPAEPGREDKVEAVAGLVVQAAQLQLDLIGEGFFARGGLTLGMFHIRDGLIFGPALADAYELESRDAVHPRIVLDKLAEATQRGTAAVDGSALLCDADGWTFINYLNVLFDDIDPPVPALERHRDVVLARLDRHREDKRVWEKYRWVAEYHNHFVTRHRLCSADLLIPADAMTWRFEPFGFDA